MRKRFFKILNKFSNSTISEVAEYKIILAKITTSDGNSCGWCEQWNVHPVGKSTSSWKC